MNPGWLGVLIQKVTSEIAESLGLDQARGALVADVVASGPAAAAGVKVGDVIVEFDGHPVSESNELPMLVARTPPGFLNVSFYEARPDHAETSVGPARPPRGRSAPRRLAGTPNRRGGAQ